MANSITDYLWRHGVILSPRFSEERDHDNWHDWKAVEEQLKVTSHNGEYFLLPGG